MTESVHIRAPAAPPPAPGNGPVTPDGGRPPTTAACAPRIIYCGGCNPQIDRAAIARELRSSPGFMRLGATVYLSGCQRSCASDHRLTTDDPDEAVVAGACVDGVPTTPDTVSATIIDKLKE